MYDTNLSGTVNTVLGPVRSEELGPTTTHEHLLIDLTCLFSPPTEASEIFKASQPVCLQNHYWVSHDAFRNRDNLELLDEEKAISEALLFKRAGGCTVVDATTIGIGRDPDALARIARATGLNIVMGTGYYVDSTHPDGMNGKTEAVIAEEMIADITVGAGTQRIKAGVIGELGCSWPLTLNERKVLVGAAQAQRETGVPILIHPGRDQNAPFEILDILSEASADVGRVIMCHLDRTFHDVEALLDLAARGCYLEYDGFGWETSYYPLGKGDTPSDSQRLGFIELLVREGCLSRLVIAQDICTKHRTLWYGGHGYAHILEHIVPRMREEIGLSDEVIETLLVHNPARIFSVLA